VHCDIERGENGEVHVASTSLVRDGAGGINIVRDRAEINQGSRTR